MKSRALLRPAKWAAVIVVGGLLGGAARAQSPELGAPSISILPPPDILESVRYLGLDPTGEPVLREPEHQCREPRGEEQLPGVSRRCPPAGQRVPRRPVPSVGIGDTRTRRCQR